MAKKKFRAKTGLIVIAGLILVIALSSIYYLNTRQKEKAEILSRQTQKLITPTPMILPNGLIAEVKISKKNYKVLMLKINPGDKFTLIPNFREKIIPDTLVSENNCRAAVNGGFYKENETPLGLMIIKGNELGKPAVSRTANAFFWQDNNFQLDFAKYPPADTSYLDFIFQTGPLITLGNRKLSTTRDEYARRSLIGRDTNNNYYLLSVIAADNTFSGPFLSEIPLIFNSAAVKNIVEFNEVLNLDGGSASFYYSTDGQETLTLSALSPVGSLLCLQK